MQLSTCNYIIPITAVWRNWGFRQTHRLVLYLEVWSLIHTFGYPNPQLTPSHETLTDNYSQNSGAEFTLTKSRQNLLVSFGIMKHKVGNFAPVFQKFRKKAELKN